ncbi:hypothetical protein GCM10010435_08660 [Winogradskya consettensis]|uniref:Uncharacterized protein n=1 Tax=Winogradskya consettensis TaxID=113560 RepID=A0A919VVG7_9ACTN|nr:hypothetical protein [Actinoplanes consettensis]GIM80559.1 hypothetical protein Aco04nite_71380 [Actinoplanes consettensis]
MARRTFRRASTLVLGLMLAVTVGAGSPALASPSSSLPGLHGSSLAEKRADPKWYVVQSSYKGQPEFLFEIAERFLGDGNRNLEIFELNKGRLQFDGKRVQTAEAIEPGWILVLPDDAKGDGVNIGPLPPLPEDPDASGAPSAAASESPDTDPTAAAPGAADSTSNGSPLLVILLIVGVVLILAGLVIGFLLIRRRRNAADKSAPAATPGLPYASPAPKAPKPPKTTKPRRKGKSAPGMSARTFDTAAAWTVDRALRVLVTGSEAAGRPVPPVYGVSLDDTRISLRLAVPGGDPTEPWEAVESGRVWQSSLRDLQALPARNDVVSPTPRLVTLGTTGVTRELVDLGQATGVISIEGDGSVARELVGAWVEELIRSPWADDVRVIAGDVRPHLPEMERLSSLGSIRDALTTAEGDVAEGAYALRNGGSGAGLGVLILGSPPGARDMERVQNLVNRPDAAWVVIVVGQTRQGRWRFTVHPDGRLDTGALGLNVYTGRVPAGQGN